MEELLNSKYPDVEVLAFPSGQFVSIFSSFSNRLPRSANFNLS